MVERLTKDRQCDSPVPTNVAFGRVVCKRCGGIVKPEAPGRATIREQLPSLREVATARRKLNEALDQIEQLITRHAS